MNKDVFFEGVVLVANVGVFLLTVPFFLDKVHHHWIIPVFAAGFFFQSIIVVPSGEGDVLRLSVFLTCSIRDN